MDLSDIIRSLRGAGSSVANALGAGYSSQRDLGDTLKFPETRKYLRGIGGDIQESGVIPRAKEYLEGLGSDYYGATQGEFVDREPGRYAQTGPETYGDMEIGGGRQEPGFLQNLGSDYYRASHPDGGLYQAGADLQRSGVIPKTRDVLESLGSGIANANIPSVVSNMQEDWRQFGGDVQDVTNQWFNPYRNNTSIQSQDATSGEAEAVADQAVISNQNPRGMGYGGRDKMREFYDFAQPPVVTEVETEVISPTVPQQTFTPEVYGQGELYPGHAEAAKAAGAGGILGLLSGRHGKWIDQNKARMKEYGIPLSLGDKYSSEDWEKLQRIRATGG